jgi:hypothetical protein
MTRPDPGLRSGAGWSAPGGARGGDGEGGEGDGGVHPFAAAEARRYDELEQVGAGGMGTVAVAFDRRLGREVALKRIADEHLDPTAAARLAREAWITARLEHPGIVAVYDAGVDGAGRFFYTMRLIRGRSLADAIRDADGARGRLALLRHFVDACQAMAYAHRHGVVHRDLKPANVMVGEFAETQVVDWGLGRADDDAELAAASTSGAPPAPAAALPILVTAAGLLGTPAYLAPERVVGGGGDRAGDVWALGAILFEILTGRRLMADDDPARVLATLRGEPAGPRAWPTDVPPELGAIADKALAWAPSERYADAGALAADVARYLDGRRVEAHAYSTLELVRRLAHAWRWPIRVAAGALVAALVVLAMTWRRIEGERARAVDAEAGARSALRETGEALGWALDASALAAFTAGDVAEAEVIAAHALTHHGSPAARGVVMAARAGARPRSSERIELPGCARLLPAGDDHALCLAAGSLARWRLRPPRERWRVPLATPTALALGDDVVAWVPGSALVVLDGTTGAERARLERSSKFDRIVLDREGHRALASDTREVVEITPDAIRSLGRPCFPLTADAIAGAGELLYAACADGRLVRGRGDRDAAIAAIGFGAALKPASAMAISPDGARLAIGGIGGEVVVVELGGATPAPGPPRALTEQPIAQLAFTDDGLLVGGEDGAAAIWTGALDTELVRLPAAAAGVLTVDGGAIVSAGARRWRWELPDHPAPRRYAAAAGLSGAALSDDGRWLAAARGDGAVSVWSLRDGSHRAIGLTTEVVKQVDFSPDGGRLVAGLAQAHVGSAALDTATWTPAPHAAADRGVARLGHLAGGDLVALHYGPLLSRWRRDLRLVLDVPLLIDGDLPAGRGAFWLLGSTGRILRLDDDARVEDGAAEVAVDVGARAIAASRDGRWLAAAHPTGLAIHDLVAGGRRFVAHPGAILDLAISPDGRWLAGGDAAGFVTVWSLARGEVVATLRGHGQRVAWVGFALGDLWSASWDGTIRRWDVAGVDAAPARLVAEAEAAWRLELADALDATGAPGPAAR